MKVDGLTVRGPPTLSVTVTVWVTESVRKEMLPVQVVPAVMPD